MYSVNFFIIVFGVFTSYLLANSQISFISLGNISRRQSTEFKIKTVKLSKSVGTIR